MINQIIAIFLILIGLLMIGLWIFLLIKRDENPELIQEFKKTPHLIKLHLVAEFTTAILAIISGVFILLNLSQFWILTAVSLGMIFFASLQALISYSLGGEKSFIVMLGIITSLTFLAIISELSMGFMGNIQGSEQSSEILWLWILTAICLGMALYIMIQTIGVELHFRKGKGFDRHFSLIFVSIFLIITIIMLILYLP
ncbi:MAG: hypothetical protein KGD63_09500 [Candidatus Lokiarchaeota archaeon]|nr:hypothetical protein [Candidatus Lokiarchaeota archaeon]